MADAGSLFVSLGLKDVNYVKGLKNAQKTASTFSQHAQSLFNKLNFSNFLYGSVGIYALQRGLKAVMSPAVSLEAQLAQVSTMLDKTAMSVLPKYRKELKSMSIEFGESTSTLSKGLYDILSASIGASQAIGVLRVSSKAAVAGLTDTGVAADAITTIINAYGMRAEDAGRISDILFGVVKRGKCLTGDTRVLLSDGKYVRIDSLSGEVEIVSWDYRNFIPMKAQFVDMGIKQTVKITTKPGREITTTPEHPYLTPDGWKKVNELKEGDKIAVPSSLPFFGNIKPKDGWAELLGYLLAEGSIKAGSPRLAIADPKILKKIKDAADRYGINVNEIKQKNKPSCPSYMLVANSRGGNKKNSIIEKLREYNLWGINCYTKFIPDEVFTWEKEEIAKLLCAYFSGDGWLCKSNQGFQLGYCSVSERLVRDIAHLLLRFGINGYIRKTSNDAWTWISRRFIEIKRFIDFIGIERESKIDFLKYIPVNRGSQKHLTSAKGKPRKREKHRSYGGVINTDNQLYYQKIKLIEYGKSERVYDLIVPGLHNFVANDILAHNTTFAQLAPTIGMVAATAAQAGLKLEELGASIATMTRAGLRSEMAVTSVMNIMTAFLSPAKESITAAKEFGLELNTTTLRTLGLGGVMKKLTKATAEQVSAIFPNIRGLRGFMAALSDVEGYAYDYQLMLNSLGLTEEAFAKQTDTAAFKLRQLKKIITVIVADFGTEFLPKLKEAADKTLAWYESNKKIIEVKVKEWAGKTLDSIIALFEYIKTNKDTIVLAFKLMFGAAIVLKLATMTTAVYSLAKAIGVLKLVSTPGGLVILGTLAIGGGIYAGIGKIREHLEKIAALKFDNVKLLSDVTTPTGVENYKLAKKNIALFKEDIKGLAESGKGFNEIWSGFLLTDAAQSAVSVYGTTLKTLSQIAYREFRAIEIAAEKAEKAEKAVVKSGVGITRGLTIGGKKTMPGTEMLHGAVFDPYTQSTISAGIYTAKATVLMGEYKDRVIEYYDIIDKAGVDYYNAQRQRAVEFGNFWGSWLFNMASDAKVTFESIQNSFLRMMANMATQAAATALFSMLLTPAEPIGFFAALKNLIPGFAGGGMVHKPSLVMAGERGAERILNPQETREYNQNNDSSTWNISFYGDSAGKFSNKYELAKQIKELKREGYID